jgi:hypothetical protein
VYCTIILKWLLKEDVSVVLLPAAACGTNKVSHTGLDRIFLVYSCYRRYALEQLVESLCFKLDGRGLDFQWGRWNF